MNHKQDLSKILIIDDLYGRQVVGGRNEQRADFCARFLLNDVTGDEQLYSSRRIKEPVADAVFFRGQSPLCANIGDLIENDIEGTLNFINHGWDNNPSKHRRWALVLLDLCFYTGEVTQDSNSNTSGMPQGQKDDDNPGSYFGLKLLKAINERFSELPVVLLSSMEKNNIARQYSRLGALGFLPKADFNAPELLKETLWRNGLIEDETGRIIGRSLPLLTALREARRASQKRNNVLFLGETGTGKELIVPYIHQQQDSADNIPFITLNCGALSSELFASDLFGHTKGSYTGAVSNRIGKILQADGGDLFMDEIANMPHIVQEGLLRTIENKIVTPLGSSNEIHVDVRFLSATNVELENTKIFKPDLYARLCEGGIIQLPALRDRMDDLPLLINYFVRQAEALEANPAHREIEKESIEKLSSYNWHRYNIRELRRVIFDSVSKFASLEYMSPQHIKLPDTQDINKTTIQTNRIEQKQQESKDDFTSFSLDDIVEIIEKFNFKDVSVSELAGKLPMLERASALLLTKYLKRVLEATSQPTLARPEGELRIHPALKLATGDEKFTASKAADKIKKILSMPNLPSEQVDSDEILTAAKTKSLNLRPKRNKKNNVGSS